MNRKRLLRVLLWAAAVLWMILIFSLSAQPAAQSSETSTPFVDAFLTLVRPGYRDLSPEARFELREQYSFIVRKAAHFTIYTVLGILLTCAVSAHTKSGWRYAVSFLIGVLYAVSDEIHQYFVPGRSCELRDTAIDSAGILTGILLCAGIAFLLVRTRKKPVR